MRAMPLGAWVVTVLVTSLLPSCVHSATYSSRPAPPTPIVPSEAAARRNAFKIFNALHSAMRQWGSSLDHNGMSYFLATVPEGSVFFHGDSIPERPSGAEWLAFEIEHAQVFARSEDFHFHNSSSTKVEEQQVRERLRHGDHGSQVLLGLGLDAGSSHRDDQHPLSSAIDSDPDTSSLEDAGESPDKARRPRPQRRYLQTYRAARPLNLLYIDGMAAGKSDYGTLDTQDYVLLGWDENEEPSPGRRWGAELRRAQGLCDLAASEWAVAGVPIDGFVRMEAGFEIIYCHFEEGGGLELVASDASPFWNETGWVGWEMASFEWLRACSLRYNGFPSGRIAVDWSSMVSAFFYDINLTNPDATRSELPRVLNTTRAERQALKARVTEVLQDRHPAKHNGTLPTGGPDWQGIVDAIVTRYSDRLPMLAAASSRDKAVELVNWLLSPFADTTGPSPRPSVGRCKALYLEPALARKSSWTSEDALIYTAVDTVLEGICWILVSLWDTLNGHDRIAQGEQELAWAALDDPIDYLMGLLRWNTWRECGRCGSSQEICFVAMFPVGQAEDHYSPRCKHSSELSRGRGGYWAIPSVTLKEDVLTD